MNQQLFYQQLQKDAERIVEKAATILISYEKKFSLYKQKDEIDVATTADTETEKFIIGEIHKKYPDHGIYGEEFGKSTESSEYTWIIDPLDGTKEYVRGLGEYNCLIAVEEKEKLVAGVMKRIGKNALYASSKGNGAFLDGNPIHVSKTDTLILSFVGMHFPNSKNTKEEIDRGVRIIHDLISKTYRLRPTWDDARLLGWLARGAIDGYIIPAHLNYWYDVAPSILLVEEAGGKITDWNGNPIKNRDLSKGVVASNGHIHKQLLEIIKKVTHDDR